MMKWWVLWGIVLGSNPAWASDPNLAARFCEWSMLAEQNDSAESKAASMISFISRMENQGLVGADQLKVLLKALSGEESIPLAKENTISQIYSHLLGQFLRSNIDRDLVERHLRNRITSLEMDSEKQVEVVEAAVSTHWRLKVFRIRGGEFHIPGHLISQEWGPERTLKIDIPYDLEVMDVPVTQRMWLEFMRENVTKFADDIDPKHLKAHALDAETSVVAAPDHPVDHVTYNSAVEFANRVSRARGLPPAYEQTPDSIKDAGRAEDGTLNGVRYRFSADRLRDVRGFRFPMQYEWLRMIGEFSREIREPNDRKRLPDRKRLLEVGWFLENSPQVWIQPVGQLDPIWVDGQCFFDLLGNVREMVHRSLLHSLHLENRIASHLDDSPPHHELENLLAVGGCTDRFAVSSGAHIGIRHADQEETIFRVQEPHRVIGFRLVRSVPRRH